MAFQVPASQQSIGQDAFTFGPETGDEFSVRKAKYLKITHVKAMSADSDAALAFFGADGTDQGAFINSLDLEQFQALVAAWREDSGLTAGESKASAS